jgi:poly(3-hydroxybutyrate) depolymerase
VTRTFLAIALVLALPSAAHAREKIVKETMIAEGAKRTYYLFVPDGAKEDAPLIILLHGSGRDGKILVDHWQSLAKKEGIILAGPDATVRDGWSLRDDGPLLLRHLVEALSDKIKFDTHRVYIFGHSAGAIHGLTVGLLESEYFAAVAIHAGALGREMMPYFDRVRRKIPVAIWVGTNDRLFPLEIVRQSRDILNHQGFNAELTEINGHTHDYYSRSSEINKSVWAFLQNKRLDYAPRYQDYVIGGSHP